ncbi:MetQ/NlpA family ABC transporter substrate-binding protein [Levilactobacillus bambusae]|uniref:Lipoprotein n=1 Tax=Levilactobacillus bambusae TaxID=2024736 RepID=A0A2V1MZE8_9LACO|nr:MetQ/NlpA family ABC transporter substrate-binding protein [Levilactobacillus bambusae]PWG00143.1 metal ABC transporter substrate-binding protein [Levilactobacillus bambusae]
MKKQVKKLLLGVLLLLPILIIAGCGKGSSADQTVKIGIMSTDKPIWEPIVKQVAKEGVTLKLITFTDYNQPNAALTNHELDLNSFQHTYFMDQWNKAHHTDIVSIGATYLAPSRLYSDKIKGIDDIKKNDEIVIPNDATNEGRALNLLQSAKLITLKKGVALPTPKNIKTNRLNLKITPLDAAQTPRSLKDVAAAVVPNDMAANANLPLSKVIFTEKINRSSKPYVNVIAANAKDKNKAAYKKVVKAYQSEANKKNIQKYYHGNAIPAWDHKF